MGRQQAQLLSSIHLKHFVLVKYLQPEQALNEYKWKWVVSLCAERRTSITVFAAMDQLAEASHLLMQSVKATLPKNLLPPKEQDT